MATDQTFTIEDDRIVVEQFEITDSDVVEFVKSRDEPPAEALRLALRVGVSTIRLSDTTEELEFVRHEFDKLNREMEDELNEFRDDLESWFDEENGDFASIINDHFGENGRLVNKVFDPTNDGSPLEKLRSEIERELQDMRDSLLEEDVRETVEQETTKKKKSSRTILNHFCWRSLVKLTRSNEPATTTVNLTTGSLVTSCLPWGKPGRTSSLRRKM